MIGEIPSSIQSVLSGRSQLRLNEKRKPVGDAVAERVVPISLGIDNLNRGRRSEETDSCLVA